MAVAVSDVDSVQMMVTVMMKILKTGDDNKENMNNMM
jgi:hypothetical protein